MRNITISELEDIFKRIIEKLRFEGDETIEISSDLYMYIPAHKWNDFSNEEIYTGSLYDDVESLKKLVKDQDRPTTYIDFDRLASLLREISEKNNPA